MVGCEGRCGTEEEHGGYCEYSHGWDDERVLAMGLAWRVDEL